MENQIVTAPSAQIREIARNTLEGYWKPVFLAVVIYYLLTGGITTVLDSIFIFTFDIPYETMIGESIPYNFKYGGSLYTFLVGGAFEYGMTLFLVTFFRSRKIDKTLIFEGFSHFLKAFLLMLLMSIKIFLWSLLLVIPGIIAGFRYSQAFYILVDHPEYGVNQCLVESSRLMQGNKFKLFCLSFSFIGWYLLASLPVSLIITLLGEMDLSLIVFFSIVLAIPGVLVDVYVMIANTAFYELVTGKLVILDDVDFENENPALEKMSTQRYKPQNSETQDSEESQNFDEPVEPDTAEDLKETDETEDRENTEV